MVLLFCDLSVTMYYGEKSWIHTHRMKNWNIEEKLIEPRIIHTLCIQLLGFWLVIRDDIIGDCAWNNLWNDLNRLNTTNYTTSQLIILTFAIHLRFLVRHFVQTRTMVTTKKSWTTLSMWWWKFWIITVFNIWFKWQNQVIERI